KQAHHRPVLVSIADQEGSIVFQVRERRYKFRLGSTFQAEPKGPACFQDLLDDLMKLIHLDRVDANIRISVSRLFNSLAECCIEFCDARAKQILKPDKQRKLDSLLPQILNDFIDVDADGITQNRTHREMPF